MNKKLQKRKIADVVDFLIEDETVIEENKVQEIQIGLLKNYHNHPFTLYTGKRLEDMVESIRENGILNPVIVLKQEDEQSEVRYEILSGHNRVNAAKLAKLETVPCIVKEYLTKEQAYVYVIETNLMQRSFSDLLPTEKAVVLKMKYEKIANQGKRRDLQREIDKLDAGIGRADGESGIDSRTMLGKEYNLSGASVARYLRLNHLVEHWKVAVDNDEITLTMAVDISYILEEIQEYIYQQCKSEGIKLRAGDAKAFHIMNKDYILDKDMVKAYLLNLKEPKIKEYQNIKLSKNIYHKFFKKEDKKEEIEKTIETALEEYFSKV